VSMMRVGLAFPAGMSIDDMLRCAEIAESRDVESVWVSEGYRGDAFAICTAIAMKTERIRVGTSVVSVFTRSAPLIGMAAATVDAVSGGRFILGLGVSHKPTVEFRHGYRFEKPLDRMRDYVAVVRNVAAGETVNYHGRLFSINGFRLDFKPVRRKMPIYIAAVGPRMMELAGEVADGGLLYMTPPGYVRRHIHRFGVGAQKSGRPVDDIDIGCLLVWCMSENREAARREAKKILAHYMRLPFYNRMLREIGFVKEAEAILKAWSAGLAEEEIARLVPEEAVDQLTAAGTPEECRKALHELRAAGVKLPIICPYKVDQDAAATVTSAIDAAT